MRLTLVSLVHKGERITVFVDTQDNRLTPDDIVRIFKLKGITLKRGQTYIIGG